jgi:predicted transcriptional regulator
MILLRTFLEDQLRGFGELEATIMSSLWDSGRPATVREVYTGLSSQREIAYTTVLTVMDNLYRKGWLSRAREGRAHRYAPVVTRAEYGANLMREALADGGDLAETLLHFVDRMTLEEAVALRAALNAFQRRIAGD